MRLTRSPGSSYLPPTVTSRRPSSRCRCCLLLLSVPCMSEIPAGVGETTVSLSTVCGSHPLWIHRVELAFSGCLSDSPLCSLLLCWALFCVLHEILVGHRLTRSQCPHPSPSLLAKNKNALSLSALLLRWGWGCSDRCGFCRGNREGLSRTSSSRQSSTDSELRSLEPRPWSSTDSDGSVRSMRPPVTKASSFSGVSILTRGDSSKGSGSAGRTPRPGTAASADRRHAGSGRFPANEHGRRGEKADLLDPLPTLKSSCLFDFLFFFRKWGRKARWALVILCSQLS